jgi:hypothetical protein
MIDPILIPFAGIALPVILVPTILGIRYARHEREMEHAERMRALELGRTLPKDESWWTLPRIGAAIGAGVPASVFFCAWQASESLQEAKVAWIGASIVGLGAVICGTKLVGQHFSRRGLSADRADGFHAKDPIDADAFDVVSSRG